MSARVVATGALSREPEAKYTQTGALYVQLSIGCTASQRNEQTGNWEDVGADLWIRASLWEKTAETVLAMGLQRGSRVSVEGTLILNEYQDNSGQTRQGLSLRGTRLLGVIPRLGVMPPRPQAPAQPQPQAQGAEATDEPPF